MAQVSVALIFLILAGFACVCIFALAVYMVKRERFSTPISRRVYPLVVISLGANFIAAMVHVMEGILFFEYEESQKNWTLFYLGILSEYWVVAPYVCRVLYVRASARDKRMLRRLGQHLYFRQSLRYMVLGFLPLLIAVVVLGGCSALGSFPYSFDDRQSDGMVLRKALWLVVYFVVCMTCIISTYQLRKTATKYNISSELAIVCSIFCVSQIVQVPFSEYEWAYFNITLRNLLIICVSGIWPAWRLKKQRTETLVTPEVVSCFELALLQKDALKGFLLFLQSDDCGSEEHLLWLILALNELELSPSYEEAKTIYDTYVKSSGVIPLAIREQVKLALSQQTEDCMEPFKKCRMWTLRRLKLFHFPMFQQSMFFESYRKRIETMNKVIGSFETSSLEMQ